MEKVLLLADVHSLLDANLAAIVIGVDHESVMRHPECAELYLLLQFGQTIEIAIEPARLVLQEGLGGQDIPFENLERPGGRPPGDKSVGGTFLAKVEQALTEARYAASRAPRRRDDAADVERPSGRRNAVRQTPTRKKNIRTILDSSIGISNDLLRIFIMVRLNATSAEKMIVKQKIYKGNASAVAGVIR